MSRQRRSPPFGRWGFFMDKDSGIFVELLTYPITRQLLIGKVCFNMLLSVVGAFFGDRRRCFRAGHSHSLGPPAPDRGGGHGDNGRMGFPVEYFGDTAALDGCVQHVHGTGAPTAMLLEGLAFGVFTLVALAFAVRALDDAT